MSVSILVRLMAHFWLKLRLHTGTAFKKANDPREGKERVSGNRLATTIAGNNAPERRLLSRTINLPQFLPVGPLKPRRCRKIAKALIDPREVLSAIAFHEKAGRSQVDSVRAVWNMFLALPSGHCRHASIRMGRMVFSSFVAPIFSKD